MAAEMSDDNIAKIEALSSAIVEKVLDELGPNSETITASSLAIGVWACAAAGLALRKAALDKSG